MNKKANLLIIFLVFALPIFLYLAVKAPQENLSSAALAEAKNVPTVLQFSQEMCSECKKLETVMTPIKSEYQGKVNFVKIDVSRSNPQTQALISKHKVRVVPTLVFLNKKGKIVKRTEGSMSKEELKGYLNSICNG
jgi:thioredoxin 1